MVDNPYNKKLDTCELLLTENNGSPTKVARLLGITIFKKVDRNNILYVRLKHH